MTRTMSPLIATNLHQSRTLATLRDTLLPKLLSGEVTTCLVGNQPNQDTV